MLKMCVTAPSNGDKNNFTKSGPRCRCVMTSHRCSSIGAMAAHASELEIAKKNLTDAIGDNVKQ